jgi:geranylgeranyl pyrophosphate synthase
MPCFFDQGVCCFRGKKRASQAAWGYKTEIALGDGLIIRFYYYFSSLAETTTL